MTSCYSGDLMLVSSYHAILFMNLHKIRMLGPGPGIWDQGVLSSKQGPLKWLTDQDS